MSLVVKAPKEFVNYCKFKTMFLAGSIDMGKAENWQERLVKDLYDVFQLVIFNPRRDDWDSTWKQSIHNRQFAEQVNWELNHLDISDIIVYYFDPNGQAPITLLELGLYVNSNKKIFVCVPDGYWRKGNIEVVCDRHKLPLYNSYDELIIAIKEYL